MKAIRWGVVLALALVAGGAMAAHTGKRIVLAITQDEGELSPYTYVTGYPGWNMMSLVFDTLMLNDLGDVPRPWLAESVSSANGGRQWTIKLREGAKWHDGKPLTSEDIKFSYEYYKKYPCPDSRCLPQRLLALVNGATWSLDYPGGAGLCLDRKGA